MEVCPRTGSREDRETEIPSQEWVRTGKNGQSHWRPFKDLLLEEPRETAGDGPAGVVTTGRAAS